MEMQGLGHYLSLSEKKVIHLYGSHKIPDWAGKVLSGTQFIRHSLNELAGGEAVSTEREQFGLEFFTKPVDWKEYMQPLMVSTPERAYLEVLMDVPQKVSFEHADQLMQGLTSLSPRSLQKLLEGCSNIKVKRLFFWFADRYRYPWLEKLDRSRIDLGKGKRMLVK